MGSRKKRGAELFIEKNGLKWECQSCHNTEWLGEKIPLEIHHIDGDRRNNDASNIKILCPNCHAKTDNYKAKNRKKKLAEEFFCEKCGKKLYEKTVSGLCRKCKNEEEINNSKCNDKERLESLLLKYGTYSKVAKIFGVSDKTIAKWCKRFGIKKNLPSISVSRAPDS